MNIGEKFMPVNENHGFLLDGFWTWCGSVVKAEDGYSGQPIEENGLSF